MLLGWIRSGDRWTLTKGTGNFYDVFIALLHIAQNVVRVPHVLTIRLASGVKSLRPAPSDPSYSLTLFWSMDKPSRVFAHRSLSCNQLSARGDLNWNDHSVLKLIQFRQYPFNQVQEVELFDDHDVLRQGGGIDGHQPDYDPYGPGPTIESIDSESTGPAEVPVPGGDTDLDVDDDTFWTMWLEEIKVDEYEFAEVYHAVYQSNGSSGVSDPAATGGLG